VIEDPDVVVLRDLYEAWSAEAAERTGTRTRLERALDAFADAIDTPTARHVIDFRADGWTVQHTLACRVRGELFTCAVNRAAERLGGPPGEDLGRFPVEERNGHLIIDRGPAAG
jgi:hypothetical protein